MNINERIKQLRKTLKLSQEKFGERIKIRPPSVSLLESGRNTPSEQTIALICREFEVNERWLRTGEGSMFLESTGDLIRQMARQYGLNEREQTIIMSIIRLPESTRKAMLNFLADLATGVESASAPNTDDTDDSE